MQKVHLAENLTDPDMGLKKRRRKLEPWQGEERLEKEVKEKSSQGFTLTLALKSSQFFTTPLLQVSHSLSEVVPRRHIYCLLRQAPGFAHTWKCFLSLGS